MSNHLPNTKVKVDQTWYEIYWTSQYAQHVLENFIHPQKGPAHDVKHTDINRLLKRKGWYEPLHDKTGYLHRFVTEDNGRVYETFAYLVPATTTHVARCVVVTSYRSGRFKNMLPQYQPQTP